MTLSPAFLDELRARTTLSGLIGRAVKLIRAGREYKACCPFHQEKTPSFTVNDEKGFYHCFGCGAHGDAIRWLTDARGLPFMDAVKELAEAAGMDVPAPDPRAQAKAERASSLYEVMEAAARWFEDQLGGLEGAEARAYLERRGIGEDTRRRFGFGYAPDAKGRLRAALKEFGNDRLVEAGLLIAPEDEREPYDRFRGRLMIPIRDQRGRVIAFGGRILGEGEPKYLNSPDTPLFDKGRTLYNLDRAGPASREAKRLVVVEGYMDVIALDQGGIGEAVAPLGTALTERQIERLWRLSSSPLLCFDGDAAGEAATLRGMELAAAAELDVRVVALPPGLDPADVA
ncbi:MAG: DNA primase, partial [Pseudomonadota bacterium]|nr:DNA primase [Pseudomonadota bacterium]